MFNSASGQDEFVANILGFKKNGTYVDIGSNHSQNSNNSFFFDNVLDWKGICVEIYSFYNQTYSNRKNCTYINQDALTVDYKKIFDSTFESKLIDYLSIDVDNLSLDVLSILPKDYDYKVITIEHDFYILGDTYRAKQREILQDKGYRLLCSNVFVGEHLNDMRPFEDWWVLPEYFDSILLDKIQCDMEFPQKIKEKING